MGLKAQCESFTHDMITPKDVRFYLRGEKIFNSWEEKMLMGEDCDLNSSHIYTNSSNEVLRQTMLNQEFVFRKQVNELHRLYMIQKTLMNDFVRREFNAYNLGKASTQSTLGPFANQLSYEPVETGKNLSTIPMVDTIQFTNNDCLQEDRVICSRLQQRPLDLQLPSSHYINYVGGDLLKKGNIWDSPEKNVETKRYLCVDSISCPEEVKLSLSIGGDTVEKGVGRGTWNDKIIYSSSQHIIDLEENITNSVMKNTSHGITMTDSFVDGGDSCQERSSSNQGFYEAVDLDLNKVHLDESSIHMNNPVVAYPSTGSSSGVSDGLIGESLGGASSTTISQREPNSNPSNETSYNNTDGLTRSELEHPCCDKKKGESTKGDVLIQKAAISLVYFSLGSSNSDHDCINKAGSNDIESEKNEQPQYSLDSYESIVVKLTESSADDYCVSSKPFEVDEMDKKDCGIKLRRGTRLKDFQKDILPGLASLSRREIWEDISIMERVIRSREYKKHRSRMANGVNWFTPVKSRRSKLNYVGRR